MSNEALHVPKHLMKAHLVIFQANNIVAHATVPEADPVTVKEVYYESSILRDTQTTRHKNVETKEN